LLTLPYDSLDNLKTNMPPKPNSDPSSDGHHFRISPKATAIASAIATVGLSTMGTINANVNPPSPDHTAGFELGMQDVVAGVELPGAALTFSSPGSNITGVVRIKEGSAGTVTTETIPGTPAVTTTHTKTTPGTPGGVDFDIPEVATIARSLFETTNQTDIPKVTMEWARKFSADSKVGETINPDAIVNAAADILALQKPGTVIVSGDCHGTASDEDDTKGDNPGFGVPSAKNQRLATDRGQIVTDELAAALKDQLPGVPFTNQPGIELVDNQLADQIFQMSADRGISASQLVKWYNRGDNKHFDPAELDILQGLRNNRYVICTVKTVTTTEVDAVVMKPIPGATVEKANPASVITETTTTPGTPSTQITHVKPGRGGNVIIEMSGSVPGEKFHLIFIPMIIPIIERRKGAKGLVAPEAISVGDVSNIPIKDGDLGFGGGRSDYLGGTPRSHISGGGGSSRRGGSHGGGNGGRGTGVGGGGGRGGIYPPVTKKPFYDDVITPPIEPENAAVQHSPKVIGRDASIYVATPHRIQQPRTHNMSQLPKGQGGRTGRGRGGNRGKQSR
jgi:hypothetical protein